MSIRIDVAHHQEDATGGGGRSTAPDATPQIIAPMVINMGGPRHHDEVTSKQQVFH